METVYDWVTVAIFAGLVVLFLQRSSAETEPRDSIWQYLAAAIGCAVANYLGNNAIKASVPGQPDWVDLGSRGHLDGDGFVFLTSSASDQPTSPG